MSLVEYSLEDHVTVIRLNRPERLNAMSPAMGDELEGYQKLQRKLPRISIQLLVKF